VNALEPVVSRTEELAPTPAHAPRSSGLTICICIAAAFQLNLCGLLPPATKVVGDLVLAVAVFRHEVLRLLLARRRFSLPLAVASGFVGYVLLQMGYTALQWGELHLAVREGRRWLIAGTYYVLLAAGLGFRLSTRVLGWTIVCFCLVTLGGILALRAGVELWGAAGGINDQGGVLLFKPWIPGSLFLYLTPLLLMPTILDAGTPRGKAAALVVLALVFLAAGVILAPFRAFLISSLAGLAVTTVSALIVAKRTRFLSRVLLAVFLCVVSGVIFADQRTALQRWLWSAYDDFAQQKDNVEYRNRRFVALLRATLESGDAARIVAGTGFVHPDSIAAGILGYSTETNDAGWVEIFLTGGWIGTGAVACLYVAMAAHFAGLLVSRKNSALAVLPGVWVVGGLLWYSSNPLLWDFGFVPIVLVALLQMSRASNHVLRSGNA